MKLLTPLTETKSASPRFKDLKPGDVAVITSEGAYKDSVVLRVGGQYGQWVVALSNAQWYWENLEDNTLEIRIILKGTKLVFEV